MNKKDILNDYMLKLYYVFYKHTFKDFVTFMYSYNIANKYNDIINEFMGFIYNKVIQKAINSNINYESYEFDKEYVISFVFGEISYFPKVEVYVPLVNNSLNYFFDVVVDFIIKENINTKFLFSKRNKCDNVVLEFDNTFDFKKMIRFLNNDVNYLKMIKNKLNPFIPCVENFGVAIKYDDFNYLDFIIINLYDYFSLSKYNNNYNIDTFCEYLDYKIFNEKDIIINRKYVSLYRCLKCISDNENIFDVFSINYSMNISSVNSNDYFVKCDNDGIIYFVNIYDNIEVKYGDEFYLNVCYSKFYNKRIELENSDYFYKKFYYIYNKLLNNKYNFNDIEFSFDSDDIIYKQLYIFASGFFALKKLGFNIGDVYKILIKFIQKILNINIIVNKKEYYEDKKVHKNVDYLSFNSDFLNSVFSLKNGELITVIAYFKLNNVFDIVPIKSNIIFKDGKKEKAYNFFSNIKNLAPKYDSFRDLVNDLIFMIEYVNSF